MSKKGQGNEKGKTDMWWLSGGVVRMRREKQNPEVESEDKKMGVNNS